MSFAILVSHIGFTETIIIPTVYNIHIFSSRLYFTYIKPVPYVAYKIIFQNLDKFQTWHDRLGHPGIDMMRKIIGNSVGHNLPTTRFPKSSDFVCTACATGNCTTQCFDYFKSWSDF